EQVYVLRVLHSRIAGTDRLHGNREFWVRNAVEVTRDGTAWADITDLVAGGETLDFHLVSRRRSDQTSEVTTCGVGHQRVGRIQDLLRLTTNVDTELVTALRVNTGAVV